MTDHQMFIGGLMLLALYAVYLHGQLSFLRKEVLKPKEPTCLPGLFTTYTLHDTTDSK